MVRITCFRGDDDSQAGTTSTPQQRRWARPVHRAARERCGERCRAGRAQGRKSRGAGARRAADAGRLLPHRRRLSRRRSPRSASPKRSRASRRRAARTAPPLGRDQARALRAADRAGDPRSAARRLARAARRRRKPVRRALLGADRGSQGRELRRPVRKLPRHRRRGRLHHRGAGLLGGVVDHQCAPLHGEPRAQPRATPRWRC